MAVKEVILKSQDQVLNKMIQYYIKKVTILRTIDMNTYNIIVFGINALNRKESFERKAYYDSFKRYCFLRDFENQIKEIIAKGIKQNNLKVDIN